MSASDRPVRSGPSLFHNPGRCNACPGRLLCSFVDSPDACGDPAEYYPGGLTIDVAPATKRSALTFPVDIVWRDVPAFGSSLLIGTSLEGNRCDATRLREALRLGVRSRTLTIRPQGVVLHGRDSDLYRLAEGADRFGRAFAAVDAAFAIGPGFSTWWVLSPFDSLLAVAHSARFAARLARYVPTVPTVVWRGDGDLDRWGAFVTDTRLDVVAMDLGALRQPDRWRWAMLGVERFARSIAGSRTVPRLIANGPSTIDRLRDVRDSWSGPVTFASQRPWHLAQAGQRLLPDLQAVKDGAPRRTLERDNRETFRAVAHSVASRDDRG